MDAEHRRLEETRIEKAPWRKWGPYLSERQWGTVRMPAARVDGVLVQDMVRGGTEVIVGMKRDPAFGPVVLAGLGGIFVEVLKAYVLCCAPFDRETAQRLIARMPGSEVLGGARGGVPCDVAALAELLARFSVFAAAASPAVREIDLNPVLVLPAGRGPPDRSLPPARPEEWGVEGDGLALPGKHAADVDLQELDHHTWQGDVLRLLSLDPYVPESPLRVEMAHSQAGHGTP